MSSSAPKRVFIKNDERRHRGGMTQSRIQMSMQIRKAKKSQLISLKRRCVAGPTTQQQQQQPCNTTMVTTNLPVGPNRPSDNNANVQNRTHQLAQLASTYIQTKDKVSLHALQAALSSSDADTAESVDSLLQLTLNANDDVHASSFGLSLVNALASSLTYYANRDDRERLDACRVLTNLAAGESSAAVDSQEEADVYGGAASMKGWCSIIILSDALHALLKAVSDFVAAVRFDLSKYVIVNFIVLPVI